MSRRALIVVDVQRDFCEGGSLAVTGGAVAASDIAQLLTTEHGYDAVVATRDAHVDPGDHFSETPDFVDTWPPHCVVGTAGEQFHPPLSAADFVAVFDKGAYTAAYSGFEGADADGQTLTAWLRAHEVSEVDVCGLATDYCVRATALDAAAAGFATRVLMNLTAAVAPDRLAATEDALSAAGVSLAVVPPRYRDRL